MAAMTDIQKFLPSVADGHNQRTGQTLVAGSIVGVWLSDDC
jgi:hypothetical protein